MADERTKIKLVAAIYLPPGNAPLAVGRVVSVPAKLAAELIAEGKAEAFPATATTAAAT